ncbi:hypothetical protein MUK70_19590 [Dyadobacter chenwenxiniae]|uniref:hypothetical protein n=1 Tax=Dyadobacter chenwenxiniae TaxID=2906456 RepID=UPI001FD631B6|nr:hypothetical protein [Dyadobacter chenwenxiniae]UON81266.1 hypothetical protein MUK70_19590 [Dyadobacter chenwenxiniae]
MAQYILNADSLCVESTINNNTTIYEYANGYLRKTYNKSKPNQRREFIYEFAPDGVSKNLSKTTYYDENNIQGGETLYTYFINGQGMVDLHPIYHDLFESVSCRYLPIFGKFSAHLVRTTIIKNKNFDDFKYLREYTFYPDGRVKTEKVSNLDNGVFYFTNGKKYSSPMSAN